MRAALCFLLVAVPAVICANARGEDEEPIPARVLCEGGRLAALQIYVAEPGLITLRIPQNVCGRTA